VTSNPRPRSGRRGAPVVPVEPRPADPCPTGVRTGAPAGFRTPVRGHAFAARPADAQLGTGTSARLVREPANPRDPFAVAVWIDGAVPWRAGYLDRAVAARLAPRLDAGERWPAVIEGWVEAPGGWRRPLLAVGAPLPARAVVTPPASAGLWGRPPGSVRRTLPR
jgi:hypothetical protein